MDVVSEDVLWKTVRAGFALRRKTLLNSLQTGFPFTKDQLADTIKAAGIDPSVRGERLSLEEYAALANCLQRQ